MTEGRDPYTVPLFGPQGDVEPKVPWEAPAAEKAVEKLPWEAPAEARAVNGPPPRTAAARYDSG